jgi:hypothetical protein
MIYAVKDIYEYEEYAISVVVYHSTDSVGEINNQEGNWSNFDIVTEVYRLKKQVQPFIINIARINLYEAALESRGKFFLVKCTSG